VISITFRAVGSGTAAVRLTSGQVLANDGKGTNIVQGLNAASYVIKIPPPPEPEPEATTTPPVEPPPPPPPPAVPPTEPGVPPAGPFTPGEGSGVTPNGELPTVSPVSEVNLLQQAPLPDWAAPIISDVSRIIDQQQTTTKAVATGGLLLSAVQAAAVFGPDLYLMILRGWLTLMSLLGLRRRTKPWGTVFDSETKRPLDPVYVSLQDLQGNEVATSITDINGRYGFLVSPGKYRIVANKTHYLFPSQRLANEKIDVFYDDLYFGDTVEVKETGDVITKNIPMDSLKFDWNEYAKKNHSLLKFFAIMELLKMQLIEVSFIAGFATAVTLLILKFSPLNLIILMLYLVIYLLRRFLRQIQPTGAIVEAGTSYPVPFALIKVSLPDGREIARHVADRYGHYYFLLVPGKYLVTIERKNLDGSYSQVFTGSVPVPHGILKKRFVVMSGADVISVGSVNVSDELREEVIDGLRLLEKAKNRRSLTPEEQILMEHLKHTLGRTKGATTPKVKAPAKRRVKPKTVA
jgi:hypothetical protein